MLIFVSTHYLVGTILMNQELTVAETELVKRKRRTYSDDMTSSVSSSKNAITLIFRLLALH